MKRSTTPRSTLKKNNAARPTRPKRRKIPTRTTVRYKLFRAFVEGDGVSGHALPLAREEANGVMAILDRCGVRFEGERRTRKAVR